MKPRPSWSYQRKFHILGSLTSVRNRLLNISEDKVIIPEEKLTLQRSIKEINEVLSKYKERSATSKKLSNVNS